MAKCKVCNGLLSLLLELNGDLPEQFPGHERRLYIWSCKRKTCRRKEGSVRGMRGVRVAQGAGAKAAVKVERKVAVEPEARPLPQLGESLFGVKNGASTTNPFANPFASNEAGKAPVNPFAPAAAASNSFPSATPAVRVTDEHTADEASTTLPETFADKVRVSSSQPSSQPARPHEPWPTESAFPAPYPQYYLDAEYETLDAPSRPHMPESARMDVDMDGDGTGGKEDKEVYESSLDKTFQRFADRAGQNPEQVLRYEYRGKPLLYSDGDSVGKLLASHSANAASSNVKVTTSGPRGAAGMAQCPNCGADRVFEVQLTPHAITELEAMDMSIDGMEWGTILLGVCSKDCKPGDVSEGEVGYLEEWVGVQWEEVASNK